MSDDRNFDAQWTTEFSQDAENLEDRARAYVQCSYGMGTIELLTRFCRDELQAVAKIAEEGTTSFAAKKNLQLLAAKIRDRAR